MKGRSSIYEDRDRPLSRGDAAMTALCVCQNYKYDATKPSELLSDDGRFMFPSLNN